MNAIRPVCDVPRSARYVMATLFALSAAWCVSQGTTRAADVTATWLGGNGNWSDPARWDANPFYPNNGNGRFTFDAVVASGTAALTEDVTVESLNLGGRINGAHRLILTGNSTWTGGTMRLGESTALENQGSLVWRGGGVLYGGATPGGGPSTIINQPSGVFDFANDSTLNWDYSPRNVFMNSGTLRKSGGTGVSHFYGWNLDNNGVVEVQNGALRADAGAVQLVGNTLTGGTWIVGPSATLYLSNDPSIRLNQAHVELIGTDSRFPTFESFSGNQGTFIIRDGRDFTTAAALNNAGTIGVGANSTLTVTGNFATLLPTARLAITVPGDVPGVDFGTVNVAGQAILNGALDIELAAGFTPTLHNSYDLLTAVGGVRGFFSGLPESSGPIGWRVHSLPDRV